MQSVAAACQLLRQFDCLTPSSHELAEASKANLREALKQIAGASDYQILGICADNLAAGRQALQSYATALGYQPDLALQDVEGAVYIKFNPRTGLCYAHPYSGTHRGVLVACQSAEATDVNELFGHLPLHLFD
jgi:ferric-dicitrate binding protein FerR (iron transport regulator)